MPALQSVGFVLLAAAWSLPFGDPPSQPDAEAGRVLEPATRRPDATAVPFVENLGQWTSPARFVARCGPLHVAVEPRALTFWPRSGDEGERRVVRLEFEGARDGVCVHRMSAESIYSLGRKRHQPARAQRFGGLIDGVYVLAEPLWRCVAAVGAEHRSGGGVHHRREGTFTARQEQKGAKRSRQQRGE